MKRLALALSALLIAGPALADPPPPAPPSARQQTHHDAKVAYANSEYAKNIAAGHDPVNEAAKRDRRIANADKHLAEQSHE